MRSRLREIRLGNMLRRTRSPVKGTMSILKRSSVVEIAHRVRKGFKPNILHKQVLNPPSLDKIKKVNHQALSLRGVFEVPNLPNLS